LAKKCSGCGIELQSYDKTLPGFLPENKMGEKAPVCQRCFKISNYGAYLPIDLTEADYKNEVKSLLIDMHKKAKLKYQREVLSEINN
jgi:hypothetical protein